MLKIKDLFAGYDNLDVIKDITFNVPKNQIVSLLGANGCGKTTLIKAITGEIKSKGKILVDNKDLSLIKGKAKGKLVGVLSQINQTNFPYTAYETVLMGRYAHSKNSLFQGYSTIDHEFVENSLKVTNTYQLKDTPITDISGGQLQRVFLARVFAQNPRVILLDEPTNHLDLKHQIEIMEYLKNWVSQGDRSVLSIVHDINLALNYSDNIICMKNGEVLNEKATPTLLSDIYDVDVEKYMKNSLTHWL